MSHSRLLTVVEWWTLGSALVLTVVAAVIWRTPDAMGSTASGGLIAVLNLLVLRRTVTGFFESPGPGKQAALAAVLFLKMGLLLGAIWAVVRLLGFAPLGVGIGVSALVLGVVGGTFSAAPSTRSASGA
jgi:hypothetical protein